MPYAPVKSDPYKRKKRNRTRRFNLWPEWFWTKLVKEHYGFLSACMTEIGDMNEMMYGHR